VDSAAFFEEELKLEALGSQRGELES